MSAPASTAPTSAAPMSSGMFSQRTFGRDRTPRAAMAKRHRLGLVAAGATLLATAPLATIFAGWGWLFQCAMVVGAVTAAGATARALRIPAWLHPLAMAGGLLVMLTWLFRSGEEMLGILPSPATLEHFGVLFNQLPGDVRTHSIPVPDLHSLLFVTALGVGTVAIVIDLCAVTLRRPALAGLPMLAIYSVPVAIMVRPVPAITFVIGALGYLWLLGTDNLDRVRRFGRRFTGDGRDVDAWEPSPMAAAGRRLAVIGALVAVLLPLGLPGLTGGLIERVGSGFSGAGGGGGSGTGGEVNLFAALDGLLNRDEVVPLFEVTTDDPAPHYLKIGVADQITAAGFDHRRPRGAALSEGVPAATGRAGVDLRPQSAQVRILPAFSMARLPVYPELMEISGPGAAWHYDQEQQAVFAAGATASGEGYTFAYGRPEFDPEALRGATALPPGNDLRQFAEIPAELREPEISQLVDELTSGASNDYDRVLAILGYFSRANGFTYSLETGDATTGSAIVDFLIENRQGYCVQYAAGMAWMVRELGLPSRVAIGFTSGRSRTEGSFTVTNHNAHAWTEVYFQGLGWVPFEPTPRSSVSGAVATDWAPDPNAPDPNGADDPGSDTPGVAPELTDPANEDPLFGDDGGTIGGGGAEETGSRTLWWVAGAVALLLVLLATPALSRAWLRRIRLRREPPVPAQPQVATAPPAEPAPGVVTVETAADPAARQLAHAAWDELLDTMVDFGVPLDPAETPRATVSRLVTECRLDPDGAGLGARLLGKAEERARYARTPVLPVGLLAALRSVRSTLAHQATRRMRLRAALLPPSTLLRWRQAVADATTSVASTLTRWNERGARLSPRRLLRSS